MIILFFSKHGAVSRQNGKIYCWGGRGGERGEIILLAARCYRNKPDITTVLMGRLTCLQTLLCKIVICLK